MPCLKQVFFSLKLNIICMFKNTIMYVLVKEKSTTGNKDEYYGQHGI